HRYPNPWGSLPAWTERALEAGDFFHVEPYGTIEGYLYDFSRTSICGGEAAASSAQLDLIQTATDGIDAGVAAVRPGAPAKDVFHAVRGVLEERGAVGDGLNV